MKNALALPGLEEIEEAVKPARKAARPKKPRTAKAAAARETPAEDRLTDEQMAVVGKSFSGQTSLTAVQAYAGAGKTHTLKAFAKAHPDEKILYLTFSKALADEAAGKFAKSDLKNVDARTIHSLAYRWFMGAKDRFRASEIGGIQPVSLAPWAKHFFGSTDKTAIAAGAQMVSWLERFFTSDAESPGELLGRSRLGTRDDRVGIRDKGRLEDALNAMLDSSLNGRQPRRMRGAEQLPLPHNGYLKMMQLQGGSFGYDFVLVDEAQDVSSCMISAVERQNCHCICIGDTFQQIYAWNGAVNALPKLVAKGAEEMFLTKSFRCPEDAARNANLFLQALGAKKPFLGRGDDSPVKTGGTEAYLSRSNAGVFAKAWECVEKGRAFSLAGGVSSYNFEELLDLEKFMLTRKAASPRMRDIIKIFPTFKEYEAYAKDYEPHVAAQCALVRKYAGDLAHMLFLIRQNAGRKSAKALTISTAHKAKGGEWDKIVLGGDFYNLNKDIMAPVKKPSQKMLSGIEDPSMRSAYMRGQKIISAEELRLLYVAVTRTKGRSHVPEDCLPTGPALNRLFSGVANRSIILL